MPIITKQDVTTRAGSAPGLEVSDLVDAAQGSQSLKIGRGQQHDNGETDGDEQGIKRNSMSIEPFELPRHFAVARGHVEQTNHGDDRRVGRAQRKEWFAEITSRTRAVVAVLRDPNRICEKRSASTGRDAARHPAATG